MQLGAVATSMAGKIRAASGVAAPAITATASPPLPATPAPAPPATVSPPAAPPDVEAAYADHMKLVRRGVRCGIRAHVCAACTTGRFTAVGTGSKEE